MRACGSSCVVLTRIPLHRAWSLALRRLLWSLPPPPAHPTHGPAFHLPALPEHAPAPWLAAPPLPRRCRSVGKDTRWRNMPTAHVCLWQQGYWVTAVTGQMPLSHVTLLQDEASLISPVPPPALRHEVRLPHLTPSGRFSVPGIPAAAPLPRPHGSLGTSICRTAKAFKTPLVLSSGWGAL